MAKLSLDIEAVIGEVTRAPRGSRRQIVGKYAELSGVSIDTIYRQLRAIQGPQKKVVREKMISQELIDLIAKIKLESKAMIIGGNREMTTEDAIDILKNMGHDMDGVKVSTVNRRLREAGFRQMQPKVRFESDHVNQEHMIDFSRSKYFQVINFDLSKNDYILKVSGRELSYKENEKKLRLWLAHAIDTFSRCTVTKYYAASGESYLMGVDMLQAIWTGQEWCSVKSIPEILKVDNGAFAKKKEVKAMMEAFEVEMRLSRPYGKDAMGKVERPWRTLWQRMEMKLAYELGAGAVISLGDLNSLVNDWEMNHNQTAHPVQKIPKAMVYRKGIIAFPERIANDELLRHAYIVEERTVDTYLRVSYKGVYFEAPEYTIGQRIRIFSNLNGELMGALIGGDGKEFELKPWAAKSYDDYEHRAHQTYIQKIETAEAIRPAAERKAIDKRMLPAAKPVTVNPNTPFEKVESNRERFLSRFEARVYVAREFELMNLTFTSDDIDDFLDTYLDYELTRASVDTILNELNNKQKRGEL